MILFLNIYTGHCQSSCGSLTINGPVNVVGLLSQVTSIGNTIGAQTFYLNGVLTVDQSLTLDGTTIYMSPTAKIIVKPGTNLGVILEIKNSTKLTSCNGTGDMWYGIEIDNTSTINAYAPTVQIDGGSLVEDAQNGILCDVGNYFYLTINNAYFNRNYRHLFIRGGGSTAFLSPSNVTITNSKFVCRTNYGNPATSSYCLHNPFASQRTWEGINFDWLQGNATNKHVIGTDNLIENCDYGLSIYKSAVEVRGNIIRDCDYGMNQFFDGFSTVTSNTFYNSNVAIAESNHVEEIEIIDNTIDFVNYGIYIGWKLPDILISDNRITDAFVTGISVDNAFNPQNLPPQQFMNRLEINNNTILNTGIPGGTAIVNMESGAPLGTLAYAIHHNIIDNYNSGIVLNYIQQSGTNPVVSDNILTTIMDRPGISLTECPKMECVRNSISGGQTEYCTANQIAYEFDNSNELTITCNTSMNMARAFVFKNSTLRPVFEENTMDNYVHGVYLDNNPRGLGDLGHASRDAMNIWGAFCDGSSSPAHTRAFYSNDFTVAGFTNFYYQVYAPPTINSSGGGSQYLPCTYTKTPWVREGSCTEGGGGSEEERMLNAIAEGDFTPGLNDYHEGVYLNNRLELRNDYRDSLPILQDLYDSLQTSPVAQIELIEQLLADSDTTLLPYINQEITSLNASYNFEYAYSILYPILAKIDSTGIDYLDTLDKSILTDLAFLCASQYGTAVHRARSLYYHFNKVVLHDDNLCQTNITRLLAPVFTDYNENKIWHISNEELIFSNNKNGFIRIFDSKCGQVLAKSIINSKVELHKLPFGIYHFNTDTGISGNFIHVK